MNEIEQAIKAIENIAEYWTCRPSERQAAQLALAALREQQERSKGCEYCNSRFGIASHHINEAGLQAGTKRVANYCPNCGKRLEVEP